MAYLKLDDLFKKIVTYAEKDRLTFIDALPDGDPMVEETRAKIDKIKALSGMPFKVAMAADKESVRLACLFAEYWYDGLAYAHGAGREFTRAMAMYKKIKQLRLRYFGLTKMESLLLNAESIPIRQIMQRN